MSHKHNSKNLWEILNRLMGKMKYSVDDALNNFFDGNDCTSKEIANKFASTFNNSVKQIIPKCLEILLDKVIYESAVDVTIQFMPADSKSVEKVIKSISSNKAPRLDKIRAIGIMLLCRKIKTVIAS